MSPGAWKVEHTRNEAAGPSIAVASVPPTEQTSERYQLQAMRAIPITLWHPYEANPIQGMSRKGGWACSQPNGFPAWHGGRDGWSTPKGDVALFNHVALER
jgi:hypothetical protein